MSVSTINALRSLFVNSHIKKYFMMCYLMSTERMKTLSKSTFLSGIKMVISKKVFREGI